jgi:hypothetical protein
MSIALQWQYFGQWPIYSVWESTIGMALVASAAATLAYARQLALFIRSTRIAYFSEWLLLIPGRSRESRDLWITESAPAYES